MDKNLFIETLWHNDKLSEGIATQLDEVIREYPYFYQARVLKLIALKNSGSATYISYLGSVSALAPNRYKLFIALNPQEKLDISSINKIEETVDISVDEPETPEVEVDFQLDESTAISEEKSTLTAQEVNTTTSATELLEINDSKDERAEKPKHDEFIDAQLYTLEIPGEQLDESAVKSLSSDVPKPKKSDELKVVPPYSLEHESASSISRDEENSNTNEQDKLIDAFISSNPRIVPRKPLGDQGAEENDISTSSTKLPDDAVSQPLAEIFAAQGQNERAILIYEKLSLKYPEKRAYFAAQIEKLRK
jgi:hypothetical protein